MSTSFEQRLDELTNQVNGAVRTALDSALAKAPERGHPVVGRIYRSVYDYLKNGGKRMHGASIILSFAAVGGRPKEAIWPVAAGFQLYHYHTLVHDDIYDQDAQRRGSPTIYRAFVDWFAAAKGQEDWSHLEGRSVFTGAAERTGTIAGWVQGKVVHALAYEAICTAPFTSEQLLSVLRAMNWHEVHNNAGQMKDVCHEGGEIPDPETCLAIAHLKTGRLFQVGVEVAGLLGSAPAQQIHALSQWIGAVATAYQLQDDLEDLEAQSEKGLGRGIGSDLLTCKPTFLLSLALHRATPRQRSILEKWCHSPGRGAGEIEKIIQLVQATGAPQACRRKVLELVEEGTAALRPVEHTLDPEIVWVMKEFGSYFVSEKYWKRPLPPPHDPLSAGAEER